jgi:superfamily II DNA/RNA helicase
MGAECAWHTGDVPQLRRRAEIARFRQDPACRLFLSSDAGATGLNLQMASCVINLDLPWNPAKLEQRIARVWRKGQTRAVSVVNFVTEGSIEHSILHLLAYKQTLADGVLDGTGDLSEIKMPSGRAALIERMQAMLGQGKAAPIKVLSPEEALIEDMRSRHGARLVQAEVRADRLLVVLDGDAPLHDIGTLENYLAGPDFHTCGSTPQARSAARLDTGVARGRREGSGVSRRALHFRRHPSRAVPEADSKAPNHRGAEGRDWTLCESAPCAQLTRTSWSGFSLVTMWRKLQQRKLLWKMEPGFPTSRWPRRFGYSPPSMSSIPAVSSQQSKCF